MKPFILITLDSVPWMAYVHAHTPWMDSLGHAICGRSHGDNTISSHNALFAGHWPATEKWPGRKPMFGPCMPAFFGKNGYITIGAVALPYLSPIFGFDKGFEHYKHKIDYPQEDIYICPLDENLAFIEACWKPCPDPAFIFLNVGETHFPYWHKGQPLHPWNGWEKNEKKVEGDDRAKYVPMMAREQVKQVEWVDEQLSKMDWPEDATFYITADHGECFDEDGFLTHGNGSRPQEIYVPVICSDWSVFDGT